MRWGNFPPCPALPRLIGRGIIAALVVGFFASLFLLFRLACRWS